MNYKSYHTYSEVIAQPESWDDIYKDIVETKNIDLDLFNKSYDRVIFFGCGSSFNLGQSASVFTRYISKDFDSIAIPSSELLTNPDYYIRDSKKYLMIGFSRSGETTESVEVLKRMKTKSNVNLFAFTCKSESSFTKITEENYICRKAAEKSIVMTVSFSSMLFACCAIFATAAGNPDVLQDMKRLVMYLKENLDLIINFTENYTDEVDFQSYFVLGSGFNYGLAVEADLKMKEMSQIDSYSYYLHEFSHGPKSLLNDRSLCLVLTPAKNLLKYESSLKEYADLGTNMIVLGVKPLTGLKGKKVQFFLETASFKTDIIKSFINIPFIHLMAFFKTLKNNLNPDLPKNLSYTVKI